MHIGTPASGVYAQLHKLRGLLTYLFTFKDYPICRGASGIEIRRYAPFLIAEVTIEGDNMKEALAMGFKQASCNGACHYHHRQTSLLPAECTASPCCIA